MKRPPHVLAARLFIVIAVGLLLCGNVPAQQARQNQPVKFDFSPRKLDDGSEVLETLIRARDGLFVYGFIRKPVGPGPFPGVIMIHGGLGGNLAGTRNTVLKGTPAQLLVEHGYALLGTDYRAGDWVAEYRDVVAAYEFFKQLPYVKPEAIGVIGGSHGGKLAFELATRAPVQAAVPCAGLYYLDQLYEHCRTAGYHTRKRAARAPGNVFMKEVVEQLGGKPDEVPEKYQQYNPISRAENTKCPVLLVHGEQDASVPISFSKDLAQALTKHGKTVDTYFAPKGPHGFYWGQSAQGSFGVPYDAKENEVFLEKMVAFFDRYLK